MKRRLEKADMSATERHEIAWEMMKSGDFQNTKCAHGGPDDTPIFSIRLPQINTGNINDIHGIKDGHMEFTRLAVPYHSLVWGSQADSAADGSCRTYLKTRVKI